ncbi:MAG: M42 family metallopeptidase [Fimbriimonadaceae bacterium]|nr:M42 family metallopeptidase [Fimbriimonadaceae bacterium]
MNVSLLEELCQAHGTCGHEEAIREIVRRELGHRTEIRTDAMGNVICRKPGPGKRVMIAAHMDEIGFIVKYIDKQGFLRVNALGGWDPRQMNSQRVMVHGFGGSAVGTLMHGTKPTHLLTDSERSGGQKFDDFFIDLGLSAEEVQKLVRVGDTATMHRPFEAIGQHYASKAMDDRVGVFVMIEAVKRAAASDLDIYAVATTQEEIGLRGATAAGWSVQPDVAIALDITLANDIPGIGEADQITKLGAGTAIKIMDSSLICHPGVVAKFRELAEAHQIPHQMEILTRGGTDAGGIQRLHGGIPSFTLSIPTRYVHTVNETVHGGDVQASIDLLAAYLNLPSDQLY